MINKYQCVPIGYKTWLDKDYWPFLFMYLLIVVPYFIFEPTFLFPLERSVSIWFHLFFSIALGFVLYFTVKFGFVVGGDFKNKLNCETSVFPWANNSIYKAVLYFMFYVSIFTHIYLVFVGGAGYAEGSFIGARDSFITKGIGIPLRTYMFSIPLLVAIGEWSKKIRFLIWVICLLVCVRALILSERMAMLELLITLWHVAKVRNISLSPKMLVKVLLPIAFVFFVTIQVRLVFQSQYDESIGDENPINTLFIYYGDTTNKLYLTSFFDLEYPLDTWNAVYRELSSGALNGKDVWDNMYLGLTQSDSRILLPLNNPGGPAQDVSDFGVLGGLICSLLKIFFCAFIIKKSEDNIVALATSPIIVVHIIEYARFNYLYLPYGAAIFLLAGAIGFLAYLLRLKT